MPGACGLQPCARTHRWVGRSPNTADQSRSAPLQVPGSTLAGRVICGTDLAECVSVPGDFLRLQGLSPQDFTPFGGVGFIARRRRHFKMLSKQYKVSYLLYVTLSFLCNIICNLISVFAFSLVTLSGVITV